MVLTHGGTFNPALIGTLSPTPRASGPLGLIQAQVNDSFDRFSRDYLEAQGAYLSSGTSAAALKAFTAQRVNLLAQELTRTLSRVPGSFERIANKGQQSKNGSNVVLTGFLNRKINGPQNTSLLHILNSDAVVPTPAPSGAGATLYTLAATNAIQAARYSTINAIRFMSLRTFNNSH
jgi:hypothetical protein